MIRDKKIIGVCFTDIHDTIHSNYIAHLYHCAKRNGYKLLVFNGFSEADDIVSYAKEYDIPVFIYNKDEEPDIFPAGAGACGESASEGDMENCSDDINHEYEDNEKLIFDWVNQILDISDVNGFYNVLENNIPENSYICLHNNFVKSITEPVIGDVKNTSDELVVLSPEYVREASNAQHGGLDNSYGNLLRIEACSIVPDMDDWIDEHTLYVLSAIRAGDELCGYYAVKTDDIKNCSKKITCTLEAISVSCKVASNYFGQNRFGISPEKLAFTNALTGLPNFKGSVKWFEEFCAIPANKEMTLTVSVYALPKYTYIFENYGVDDLEAAVQFVAKTLKKVNSTKCFVGHITEDTFVIINYYDDPKDISDTIDTATSAFFGIMNSYNRSSDKEYYVEVNCGCTTVEPDWKDSLERFIKLAKNEMYMNNLKMEAVAATKEYVAPKEHYKAFELLIERNLFHYHFQPIVSARTGEIYAYEALMRTDSRIGMNPLEVLDVAKIYKRLYDVERATMFNVMERYVTKQDAFGNRKVFINTIPGYFLNDGDINILSDKYGDFMDRFVYELTEQNTVSDEELNSIRKLCGQETKSQIAIDDYGTGHSNIVNLLRYAPQVIKVDRMLITDIHKNANKQMFMRSTIEFARKNNIMVLAEGVETSNELRMVINLGVDLIQGYYTGRPALDPIEAISEDIRKEIEEANSLFRQN